MFFHSDITGQQKYENFSFLKNQNSFDRLSQRSVERIPTGRALSQKLKLVQLLTSQARKGRYLASGSISLRVL
jgi:hypothetical protein